VGKDDVRTGKPDPECYVRALETLGVQGADAVALEDSATGLSAARGAGIRTLAIGHRLPQGEWSGESAYIENTADLETVLASLGLS